MGALLAKPTVLLALVVIGLLALAVVARNWSCRDNTRPPLPPRIYGPYEVVSVPNGVTIEVRAGLRGRQTKTLILAHVTAPVSGEAAHLSQERLSVLAGANVRIAVERNRILFRATEDGGGAMEGAAVDSEDPLEARGPLVGLVYGPTGVLLNAAMIAQGYANCSLDAPKDWKVYEKEAAVARRGLWAEGRNE